MIIMNQRGQAGEALTQIIIALILILVGAGCGTAMHLKNPNRRSPQATVTSRRLG